MKKTTLNTILSLIATIDTPEAEEVRSELTAELNKGAEKAQANRDLYEAAKEVVMDELATTAAAVTIGELYEAVEARLPEGFTKGKLQYAVTRLWTDAIVKMGGGGYPYSPLFRPASRFNKFVTILCLTCNNFCGIIIMERGKERLKNENDLVGHGWNDRESLRS